MEIEEQTVKSNPSTLVTANENDGKIYLTFLNNDLEVRGDFHPAGGGGTQITPGYVQELLEKYNVVYGVQEEEIHSAIGQCISSQKIVRDVLIARGELPVNEILEYMQLNPILNPESEKGKENAQIDHRSRSPFVIVKKDEALAKQKSRKPGKNGKNVHGDSLGHGVVRPEGVSGGANTRMEGRLLLACISGQMVVSKKVVSVRDSLVIKGPVDYTTGNIIFPGDVEIEGPVSDGFKIYSGGSITIKQTFDVTDAVTRNDLTVAGGIIGKGKAIVKVGGALKAKFIENCRVASRKSINVDFGIVNSSVYTLETLEIGDKGSIVGGEIYAVKGIRTGSIGKATSKAARIHCGIDFTLGQEKEKNNGMLRLLAAKLSRLRELMNDPQLEGERKVKMEALLRRLEEEQNKTQTKVSQLLGKLSNFTDAVIEVKGEIAPGTLIEICQTSLIVTEPLKKVKIRLDNDSHKLIIDKL